MSQASLDHSREPVERSSLRKRDGQHNDLIGVRFETRLTKKRIMMAFRALL